MQTRSIKVSIIIVSYNVREYLINCLDSIYKQNTTLVYDVWVVDNASTDGSQEIVKKRYPQVNLIVNQHNVGFASANNQAIHQSSGEYIWLLNPDTIVDSTALQNLYLFLQENQDAGVAGSRLLNPDGSLQISCYPFPTLLRETWRLFLLDYFIPLGAYRMHTWSLNRPHAADNIQGASLMIPRFVLDQVGLFDEDYFVYTEEVDLNFRIQKAGWANYWVPASRVTHFGGQSTRQHQISMFLRLYQTKIHFFRKHYGHDEADRYKKMLSFASWVRVKISSIEIKFRKNASEKALYLYDNYQKLLDLLPGL